jgi:hypothetical protein
LCFRVQINRIKPINLHASSLVVPPNSPFQAASMSGANIVPPRSGATSCGNSLFSGLRQRDARSDPPRNRP